MKEEDNCQIYFVNLGELILVIIIAGLIADTVCIDCFYNLHKNQFINGVVYGFLIVMLLIVIEIFLTCDLSRSWSLIVAFLGAILFLFVAIFLFEYVGGYPNFADRIIFIRLLVAGLLSLMLTGLFIFNIYLLCRTQNDCIHTCEC